MSSSVHYTLPAFPPLLLPRSQVISQGSIQEHIYQLHREGSTSALIPFRTTHAMVPKIKLLGVFARADGELVADLIEVPVECEFENDVSASMQPYMM